MRLGSILQLPWILPRSQRNLVPFSTSTLPFFPRSEGTMLKRTMIPKVISLSYIVPSVSLMPPTSNRREAVKVRQWRHKLQKTFLSVRHAPKEDVHGPRSDNVPMCTLLTNITQEMPAMDFLFTTIEGYDNMSVQYLSVRPFDNRLGETVI